MTQFVSWKKHFRWNILYLQIILDETAKHLEKFSWKKQGEYTLKDYEAIPDEYRVELIDGVIYDLNTPTTIHQQLAFEIRIRLRGYIRQNKGLCMVLPSPVSVQLDEDDRTMLQPDVVVCCDRDKILRSHVYGAPDMVIEILSPSARKKIWA